MEKVRVIKPGKSLTKGEEQYNASRRRSSLSVNSLNTSWGRWAFWRWDETARDWSRAHSAGFGTTANAGCSPPGVKTVALPLTLDYHRFCFCFQSLSNNHVKRSLKQPLKSTLRMHLPSEGTASWVFSCMKSWEMAAETACVTSRPSLALLISKSGLCIALCQTSSTLCELLLYLYRYIAVFIGIFNNIFPTP